MFDVRSIGNTIYGFLQHVYLKCGEGYIVYGAGCNDHFIDGSTSIR